MPFTRYPEPYMAYFLQGSDPEFAVSPQAGELLPLDSAGTRLTVGFKPNMYSKKHRATLVIQVSPNSGFLDRLSFVNLLSLRIFFLKNVFNRSFLFLEK